MKKKLVIKIGTSTLTGGSKRISFGKIEDIARQVEELRDKYDIVLVSSGAIAAAKQFVSIFGDSGKIESKQAMAAIGQPKLMRFYEEIFEKYSLKTAQCLMTYRDFENETSKANTRSTLLKLLEHNYIPIVNENDTVAVEEILLGDNDKLSALVASVLDADILIIASDIDGLYDSNPHLNNNAKLIEEVSNLEEAFNFVGERNGGQGTGGMTSKIEAAKICQKAKVKMWIVNGGTNNFIINALFNKMLYTKFKI